MPIKFAQLDEKNRLSLQRIVQVGQVYDISVDEDGVVTLTLKGGG